MDRERIGILKICAGMYEAPHDQRFFGLLILLKIILYSKYESRRKTRHEGSMLALIRRLILSQKHECRAACLDT